MWFSNTFNGTSYDLDADICIDFDDSYIEDKAAKLNNMRADAQSFSDIPEFMIRYIMMSLNLDRKEAEKLLAAKEQEPDPEEED